MAADEGQRKIAAILAADAAGYSRLMADDERSTVRTLTESRNVFAKHIEAHRGRVVDTAGDSVLAVFDSVVEAIEAAIAIQRDLATRNEGLAELRRMYFRIGVNLGDIIVNADGTIYGDGVNVAARLEGLAEAGGIMLSDFARRGVEDKLHIAFADAGNHEVKNIAKPVRAFRVAFDGKPASRRRASPWPLRAGLAAAVTIVAGFALWQILQISALDSEAPAPDAIRALPSGPSIAVLPFANLGGDAAQDYFADGLTEDIIAAFTRFRNFLVIAGDSTFVYKGKTVDVREIGEELGVAYVLKGSVRRTAERIRVTVTLLDTDSGGNLWAETIEGDATAADIFDLQDQITEGVVAQLADRQGLIFRRTVTESEMQGPGDMTSYECVLRFYAFSRYASHEEHAAVRDCLEAVVEREPGYATAWVGLSEIYAAEQVMGLNTRPDSFTRAVAAGKRAVALDPFDGDAHISLAWAASFLGQWDVAKTHTDEAMRLNAQSAETLATAGLIYSHLAEWKLGNDLAVKAMRLNPSHPGWYNWSPAHFHFVEGDYALALEFAKKIDQDDWFWSHAIVGSILAHLGRMDEARAAIGRTLAMEPNFVELFWPGQRMFFPFSSANVWVHGIRDGLRKAGLAIPDEAMPTD
jgi:adenylate cyclase